MSGKVSRLEGCKVLEKGKVPSWLPPGHLHPLPIATIAQSVSNTTSPSLRENKDRFDGHSMSTGVSQCNLF